MLEFTGIIASIVFLTVGAFSVSSLFLSFSGSLSFLGREGDDSHLTTYLQLSSDSFGVVCMSSFLRCYRWHLICPSRRQQCCSVAGKGGLGDG
jgi:hypothetical protein